MFVRLGNDPDAVVRAANLCDLDTAPGPAPFRHWLIPAPGLPPWAADPSAPLDPDRPTVVLSLVRRFASRCSRPPHEVGVFTRDGSYWAVWDDRHDGFGLVAHVGRRGERLLVNYVFEAAELAAARLGLTTRVPGRTGPDETTTLEFTDPMSQRKITVTVGPQGGTRIETSGFQGKECQAVTKQLEEALGAVESDKATEEMYRVPDQTVSVGQG